MIILPMAINSKVWDLGVEHLVFLQSVHGERALNKLVTCALSHNMWACLCTDYTKYPAYSSTRLSNHWVPSRQSWQTLFPTCLPLNGSCGEYPPQSHASLTSVSVWPHTKVVKRTGRSKVFVSSELSGTHGEWTCSDDLDNPGRVRRNRETATNKHRQTTSHKKKDGSLPKFSTPCLKYDAASKSCPHGDKCRFQHPMEVQESLDFAFGVDETSQMSVSIPMSSASRVKCQHFNGTMYTRGKKSCTRFLGSPERYVCDHGSGDTGYDVEMDVESSTFIHQFVAFGQVFPGRTVRISHELAQLATLSLGILPNESRNYSSALRFFEEFLYPCFPRLVVHDHFVFYCFRNASVALPGDVLPLARKLFVPLNASIVVKIPYTESIQPVYKYNQMWKILASHGFSFDTVKDGEVLRYPTFDTMLPAKNDTASNKTIWANFTCVQGFTTYANNGSNVCSALSRYFKARENELTLRANQFKLLGAQSIAAAQLVARVCGGEIIRPGLEQREFVLKTRPVTRTTGIPSESNHYKFSGENSDFLAMLQQNLFGHRSYRWRMWRSINKMMSTSYGEIHNWVVEYLYSPAFAFIHQVEWIKCFVYLPHPKSLLRIKWYESDDCLANVLNGLGEFESKFKFEFAKVGKPGRLYASAGELSLTSQACVSAIKHMTMLPLEYGQMPNGGTFRTMYSDAVECGASDKLYQSLYALQPNDITFIYFSDDGFLVERTPVGFNIFETDVSSCDASNGFPVSVIMMWLAEQMGMEEEMVRLLAISSKPTIVRNPDKRSEYVKLLPETTFEYSGETLTTPKNDVTNIGGSYGIYLRILRGIPLSDAIIGGFSDFGWTLTCERRYSFNAGTFLKRAYSERARRSWSVYGPIFRSLRVVDGELSPLKLGLSKAEYDKLSVVDRFEKLLHQRVTALKNEPSSMVLNALRERFLGVVNTQEVISRECLRERYGVTDHDMDVMVDHILSLKLGDVIVNEFLERVYSVDYGTTPYESNVAYPQHLSNIDDLL